MTLQIKGLNIYSFPKSELGFPFKSAIVFVWNREIPVVIPFAF
jgi:hypothetical protein